MRGKRDREVVGNDEEGRKEGKTRRKEDEGKMSEWQKIGKDEEERKEGKMRQREKEGRR